MKRLISTIRWDFQLQLRNGFYFAAAVVAVALAAGLSQLSEQNLVLLLPPLIMGNMMMNTFYFIAGIVILEKGEGTMEAQVVTPLRSWEYLASKIITLTALSLIESFVIIIFSFGFSLNWLAMIFGIVLLGPIYTLFGFIAIIRYDSINEYIFPSVLYSIIFSIPMAFYFNLLESQLFYLHPLQAPLLLLKAAFQPIESWQVLYGIFYSLLWIGIVFSISKWVFYRFVIARGGVN